LILLAALVPYSFDEGDSVPHTPLEPSISMSSRCVVQMGLGSSNRWYREYKVKGIPTMP
jgi:hypothetical protein